MDLTKNKPIRKVYYDANFSINQYRGMGKFINNFVNVLKDKFEIVGLLKSNISKKEFLSFGYSNYILWEQISLTFFSFFNKGIYLFPYNTAPVFLNRNNFNVLILHDLIYLERFSGLTIKQRIGKFYRSLIINLIINKVDCVITVSEFSKKQIIEKFDLPSDKVSVIYNTIDPIIIDSSICVPKKKYFFHIGADSSYKNTKSLIFAFALLPDYIKECYKLKILGIRNSNTLGEYKNLAKNLNIFDRIDFLEYQTDKEVAKLFQEASLFLFPSFIEGFGIPLIEAMKYGCPLVISNSSCFPEIAGDSATYFDPSYSESISSAIVSCLENKIDRELKVELGYKRYKMFNFDNFKLQLEDWLAKVDIHKSK
ncbi:MAG: glycosyltransferase family 4 protein [Bacteroidetes bacterium]|nr:glycosyltransferase family 4 protein [Bacteroidota bacterium]